MTLNYQLITQKLGQALLVNELGGDRATAYRFSSCPGGKSGVSFGLLQWDIANNLRAAAILKECGFSLVEIAALESGQALKSANALAKLNAKLLEAKDTIDQVDNHELGQIMSWVRYCLASGGVDIADDETMVHLCDYHNQFYLSQGGKCIRYLQRIGQSITAFHVREFKLDHTEWGKKNPADVNRRWDNIHELFPPADGQGEKP